MMNKLENPKRIAELKPVLTLQEVGLKSGDIFCDIGAGTGLFAFAAAEITSNTVYAVDTADIMLNILHERNKNPKVIIADAIEKIPNSSCDAVLLCTVLHELGDTPRMVCEIKRILKAGGVLAIIEFHKAQTPMGPPLERRISEEETTALFTNSSFKKSKYFTLGDNFYCTVFKWNGEK